MARKKNAAEGLTEEKMRELALTGIGKERIKTIYEEGMRLLRERGQANYVSAMQLREVCLWTDTIEKLQTNLRGELAASEINGRRVAALTRAKRAAETARTEILDALLLTPQRPRGRPAKEEEDAAEEDDGWDSFDALDNGDGAP